MANFARLELTGHLGKDPVIRQTASGKSVAVFTVAFSPRPRNDVKPPPVWFNCKAFGDVAAMVSRMGKGECIVIKSASPQMEEWTSKEGEKRSTISWLVWEAATYDHKPKEDQQGSPSTNGFSDDDIPF